MDLRPKIIVRLFRTKGRIPGPGEVGRMRHPKAVRTSPNQPTARATGGIIRRHIAETIPVWDKPGEVGRGKAELDELIRRAER